MRDQTLERKLQDALRQEEQPKKLEETIRLCVQITQEQKDIPEERRTGFLQYLSDVFRYDGVGIFGLQTVTLLLVCTVVMSAARSPRDIPAFMPLFVLALMPVLFRSQYYGVAEIEAVTRASGAQVILAKLILAGVANLVCITIFLLMENSLQSSDENMGQLVLFCLVPYLVCMTAMLRIVRLRKKGSVLVYAVVMLSSCFAWGVSARAMPWLYETSAMGGWIAAFLVFTVFFTKEVCYIIKIRKEGKIYGIIN